jgi:hypothetical protein
MCAPPLFIAFAVSMLVTGADGSSGTPKTEKVIARGRVMTLPSALHKLGVQIRVDASDVMSGQVVLVGDDKSIVPLISDEASRAFFLDEHLRDRPVEINGTRFTGVPYLQVTTFRIEWDGRLETPEYFCTVCSIIVGFPQICPCCQGSMELRKKPDRR